MAEYIEREDAIEAIRGIYCTDCQNYNGVRCRACNFADGTRRSSGLSGSMLAMFFEKWRFGVKKLC